MAVADLVKMVRPLIGEHIVLEVDCGQIWGRSGPIRANSSKCC